MKNPFNTRAFKKGSLSLLITILFIVIVILVNIAATALASKYPFSLDLTSGKDYTIELEPQHDEFIRGIELPVSITVCTQKDDFSNETYAAQMANGLGLVDYYQGSLQDITKKYARQAGMFIETFKSMNDKISIEYRNPNSATDFAAVTAKYANEEFTYGDIILSCMHKNSEGETYERYQIIKMADIFTTAVADESLQYYTEYCNQISASTLATQMASALYIVTSEESVKAAVIGGHESAIDTIALEALLKKNNYEFQAIDSLLKTPIDEQAVFAIISSPTTDFSKEELSILDTFLKNDGKFARTLIYIPSTGQPVLTNLEAFLLEWGIQMLPAFAYDESGYYAQTANMPYIINAVDAGSDYTKDFAESELYYAESPYRLFKTLEDTDAVVTTELLNTPSTAVACPLDAKNDWTPAQAAESGPFPTAVIATNTDFSLIKEDTVVNSNLLVVSGDYFFVSEALTSASYINSQFTVSIFNALSGQNSKSTVTVTEKVINETSFSDKVANTAIPFIMQIIFLGLVPIGLIAYAIVIFIMRKRK